MEWSDQVDHLACGIRYRALGMMASVRSTYDGSMRTARSTPPLCAEAACVFCNRATVQVRVMGTDGYDAPNRLRSIQAELEPTKVTRPSSPSTPQQFLKRVHIPRIHHAVVATSHFMAPPSVTPTALPPYSSHPLPIPSPSPPPYLTNHHPPPDLSFLPTATTPMPAPDLSTPLPARLYSTTRIPYPNNLRRPDSYSSLSSTASFNFLESVTSRWGCDGGAGRLGRSRAAPRELDGLLDGLWVRVRAFRTWSEGWGGAWRRRGGMGQGWGLARRSRRWRQFAAKAKVCCRSSC